jgi:hypothetical protein
LKEVKVKFLIALLAAAVVFAPAASADVGEDAGNTPKRADRGAAARSQSAPESQVGSSNSGSNNIGIFSDGRLFQNPLIWVGSPNPDPPPQVVITEFQPLENVPAPLRGSFGWMKDFEFEGCVLGLSSVTKGQNVVGPYGTSTTGFSSSGCA